MSPAPKARDKSPRSTSLRRIVAASAAFSLAAATLLGFSSAVASADPTTGTISGVVTDGSTTNPVTGTSVYLSGMGALSNFLITTTDSPNGHYEFDNLPFGYYQISLQSDYSSSASVHYAPSPITVHLTSSASDSVENIAFPRWPTGTSNVSGTITRSDTGAPVSNVSVRLNAFLSDAPSSPEYQSESVTTDSNGHYSIGSLPPYDYELQLQFPETLGTYDFNGPLVNVTGNGQSVVRDDQIVPWPAATSSVSGTIVDSVSGQPISGADVELDSVDNGSTYSADTGADGTFNFAGVVPGSFSLGVVAAGYMAYQAFLGVYQYQSDALGSIHLASADATISGTVTDSDSNPLDGAGVYAGLTTDSNVGEYIPTGADGSYSLTGLEAGTYTLSVGDDGYIQQFMTVEVASGATASASFSLAPVADAGSISGIVRDTEGNPLAGICETAYDTDGNAVGNGSSVGTDPDGTYTVSGLGTGEYTLLFSDCADVLTHASTYLGDVYTLADAHKVDLTLGENSTGTANDVELSAGGTIGGHVDVSAPGGYVPFPDGNLIVPVVQQHVDGNWVDWVNQTALAGIGDGDYQVNGLPPGQFRLEFEDTNEGVRTYDTQWWSSTNPAGIASPDASSVITLAAGQVYTDKDAHMQIPVPSTAPAAPDDTTSNEDNISAADQAQQGQDITVTVGTGLAGDWISVWGHSSPVLLGTWAQVSAAGTVTVPVPTSLPAGSHNLIAQTADGTVLGSVPLTVTPAPAGSPSGRSQGESVGKSASGAAGTSTTVPATSTPQPTSTPRPASSPTKHSSSAAAASLPKGAPASSPFPLWFLILIVGLLVVVVLIAVGIVRVARARS